MKRILNLAIVHVAAALDDHPKGATEDVLADFAIDQVCEEERISIDEWQLAASGPFRVAVLGLLRAAKENADAVGTYRLCATPPPEYVRLWRAWAEDALLTAKASANQPSSNGN